MLPNEGKRKGRFFRSFIRKPHALGTHCCEHGAELRHFPCSSQPPSLIPGRRTCPSACGTDFLTETRDFPPSRHTQNLTKGEFNPLADICRLLSNNVVWNSLSSKKSESPKARVGGSCAAGTAAPACPPRRRKGLRQRLLHTAAFGPASHQ